MKCCPSSLLFLNVAPWAAAAPLVLSTWLGRLSPLSPQPLAAALPAIRLLPPEPPTDRTSKRASAIQRCRRRSAPISRLAPRSLPRSPNFSYIASGYSPVRSFFFPSYLRNSRRIASMIIDYYPLLIHVPNNRYHKHFTNCNDRAIAMLVYLPYEDNGFILVLVLIRSKLLRVGSC